MPFFVQSLVSSRSRSRHPKFFKKKKGDVSLEMFLKYFKKKTKNYPEIRFHLAEKTGALELRKKERDVSSETFLNIF
jgi:hypothetical protein